MLVNRFKDHGGELRLRAAVERIVIKDDARAKSGFGGRGRNRSSLRALVGWLDGNSEFMRRRRPRNAKCRPAGLSFVESISILDKPPRSLGYDKTIVFYNDSETFCYEKPTT